MADKPPFYALRMTNGSGQGVKSAARTPLGILQKGYDQGYTQGESDGYTQGEADGYTQGYAQGLADAPPTDRALDSLSLDPAAVETVTDIAPEVIV